MLALLLLISYSVVAKTAVTTNEFQDKETLTLNKAQHSFHKNMLQTQVMHVSIASEHLVKPSNSGYVALLFNDKASLLLQTSRQKNTFLQDVNRCESVSKLLFPFHDFW